MKKVCPSADQNAMAIPNIRNRHSVRRKSQLLTGVVKADEDGSRADGDDFARDFEENDFGFNSIPQFSTQKTI